jgi:hypothetical protein
MTGKVMAGNSNCVNFCILRRVVVQQEQQHQPDRAGLKKLRDLLLSRGLARQCQPELKAISRMLRTR